MAAPDYFPEGHVSTALEFVIAPPFRRRNLATRLLRGYVAWANEPEVPVIQCGNATIFADDEQSRHFDAAGIRPVDDGLEGESVVVGKRVSARVDIGGRRSI